MSQPLFSVVIPTFSRARFLGEAVDSVLAQTVGDFECIVVDDASPEPVALPTGDRRIRIVHRPVNGGPAAARNTGLAEARGRYVAFLDDDDLYVPHRLELALEGLGRAPAAICWTAFVGETNPRPGRRLDGNAADTILDDSVPALGATAVERQLAPAFDETLDFLEDVEWWFRLAKSHHVATVPRFGHLYRRHDNVRHRSAPATRPASNLDYLARNAAYFGTHQRAAAFRWKRCGLLALSVGDRALARRAFWHSLRAEPSGRTIWHLARSFVPIGTRPSS